MSLKTHQSQAFMVIETYGKKEFFLTEKEAEVFLSVKDHPNLKFLEFDDGGIALADIRSYEVLKRSVDASRQIESSTVDETTLNEDDWLKRKKYLTDKFRM